MKPYKAQPTARGTGLTCPRTGCGQKFILNLTKLRERKREARVKTITCPGCSKVSLIPPETDKT